MVYGLALSANGRVVASSSADGAARLYELPSGRLLTALQGHTGLVYSVALSVDGRLLASGGDDGTIRLCEVPAEGRWPLCADARASCLVLLCHGMDTSLPAGWRCRRQLWSTDTGTSLATLHSEPCYARMDITGLTGVTPAQRAALVGLGAVEHPAG